MWSRCCSRRGRQIHRLPAQRKNCWPSSWWPEQLWSLTIIKNTITSSEYHYGQTSKTQQTPKELAQDPLVVPLKYSTIFTTSAPVSFWKSTGTVFTIINQKSNPLAVHSELGKGTDTITGVPICSKNLFFFNLIFGIWVLYRNVNVVFIEKKEFFVF